jgi:hypothetical protein
MSHPITPVFVHLGLTRLVGGRVTAQLAAALGFAPVVDRTIPALSVVVGQGRRRISLAVDFLCPAECHAGSEVERPLAFCVPTRARIFWVNFRAGACAPVSEQRHPLEIAVTIAAAL